MPDKPECPSPEFMDAVCHAGSSVIDCELCGRTHFGGDMFEEGEQERLWKSEEKEPDKYVDHGIETVSWGCVDGKQVVWDCPCHKARRLEDFIWNHRWLIAEYLSARAKKLTKEAKEETDNAVKTADAVKEDES